MVVITKLIPIKYIFCAILQKIIYKSIICFRSNCEYYSDDKKEECHEDTYASTTPSSPMKTASSLISEDDVENGDSYNFGLNAEVMNLCRDSKVRYSYEHF